MACVQELHVGRSLLFSNWFACRIRYSLVFTTDIWPYYPVRHTVGTSDHGGVISRVSARWRTRVLSQNLCEGRSNYIIGRFIS